jgi:hypothetical protein
LAKKLSLKRATTNLTAISMMDLTKQNVFNEVELTLAGLPQRKERYCKSEKMGQGCQEKSYTEAKRRSLLSKTDRLAEHKAKQGKRSACAQERARLRNLQRILNRCCPPEGRREIACHRRFPCYRTGTACQSNEAGRRQKVQDKVTSVFFHLSILFSRDFRT